jgi:2-keto-4-pentenoate hydratase/2-oxohepta-3-ene-1,7-dioic acid hydratase in catechol pathway
MKLVRYGRAGAERPGLIDEDGRLRDLSRVVADITPEMLSPAGLKRLRAVKPERLPAVKGAPRLGCPLQGIGKIVCIGLNYTDHAEEVSMPLPKEPTIFIKANSAISGPDDPIARPPGARKLDYEVELVAVMGRLAGRGRGSRARPRGRVLPDERRLRARVPDGARRRHHQGQELRHVRADRAVARHRR